jgi:ABC-2 type transport system permease protein
VTGSSTDMGGSPDWTSYAPLDAGALTALRAAGADVREGLRRHHGWRYLAQEHVRNSYRRTVLGPWWLTAQQALYVSGLAFVFSQLFHQQLKTFLPYVSVGFLAYVLLLGLLHTGANVFVTHAGTIKSARQPLTSLVLRNAMIELIQFGHNAVITLVFFVVGFVHVSLWLALVPLVLIVILINGVLLGLWLGPTVARFRDVSPAIDSVMQVMVFFTPIFYKTSDLHGARGAIIRWNPFTPFIDLFRDCVLGQRPGALSLIGVGAYTAINMILAVVVFARSRSRLPYWVS